MRAENKSAAARTAKPARATRTLTFSEKLRTVPFLRAIVPMATGIVCGTLVGIPLYVWAGCAAVCAVTAWLGLRVSRKHDHSQTHISTRTSTAVPALYIALAILFFGAALARAHAPRPVVPQGQRVWMELQIVENPAYRGGQSAHTSGIATGWQTANQQRPDPAISAPTGGWRRSGERLLVSFDTMYRFAAGDRVVFRGYVNPISDTTDSYSRLMHSRGYTGRTYISQYSHVRISPSKSRSLAAQIKKLQAGATERLLRLGKPHKTDSDKSSKSPCKNVISPGVAVAAAMTTGDRAGITPELRRAYSRTGASHLLAVSGLHAGIVFIIINALLYLLPLFRGGHIIKNVFAVIAIWLYAALTGLSPSAMRAAFMFTGAQAALATSRARSSVNIMCGTAFVMLAVRPGLLFDISFQLSFIAVAAILAWYSPLYRLVESRWRGLNILWATLIVGFTASVATMPLVSHTFGVFSPAGIVLNPIVITTAYLVVIFSLVWIIAPIPLLEPVFRWLVVGPAWLQNRVVELVGEVPRAAVEYTLPLGGVFAVYALMIIFTVWLAARPHREEPFVLPQ